MGFMILECLNMCCTILECLNLNLTFDLGTWFLHATHCLVMMIISAKNFKSHYACDEVMGRT